MTFAEIEKILYKKYPTYGQYDGEDNLFLGNGKRIKRLSTMEENGFAGYAITLKKRDIDN